MNRINSMLKSKPAMPVAVVVGLAGLTALVLGIITLVGVGRFDFANKMGRFLGKGGAIGLVAGGGTVYTLAVGAIVRRVVSKDNQSVPQLWRNPTGGDLPAGGGVSQ